MKDFNRSTLDSEQRLNRMNCSKAWADDGRSDQWILMSVIPNAEYTRLAAAQVDHPQLQIFSFAPFSLVLNT
jgi:hypothetical protein